MPKKKTTRKTAAKKKASAGKKPTTAKKQSKSAAAARKTSAKKTGAQPKSTTRAKVKAKADLKARKPSKSAASKQKPKSKKTTQGAARKKNSTKQASPKKKSPKSSLSSGNSAHSPTSSPTPSKGPRFPIIGKKTKIMEMEKAAKTKRKKLSKSFLNKQQEKLIELRDHILDQMHGVAQDSLRSKSDAAGSAFGMHQADAGSDAYEKDFALSLLSQEQDALYEIDQAIKRIDQGTYGVCEMSGEQIPTARLEAIPYARFTAFCQERMEKESMPRGRWNSVPQFMNSSDSFFEESESSDDDSRTNNKD